MMSALFRPAPRYGYGPAWRAAPVMTVTVFEFSHATQAADEVPDVGEISERPGLLRDRASLIPSLWRAAATHDSTRAATRPRMDQRAGADRVEFC